MAKGEPRIAGTASRFFLQIAVCSADGPEKNFPLVRTLVDKLGPQIRILVLCAKAADKDIEDFGRHVEFRIYPGSSAIDLRGLVPSQVGGCEWVVILEDHISVGTDWLGKLTDTLKHVPADVTCVIGAAANLTSHEKWSWANFLNVQALHWAPNVIEPVQPLGFNVAYRRELLPGSVLKPGEFEVACVPELIKKPYSSAAFPADHVQHRFLPEVLYYHYCNGRVTGASIRDYHPGGLRHVFRHAMFNIGLRRREVREAIRNHPFFSELPAGTLWRVSVLAFCHSAGAIVGGMFGPGRAAWALE